MQGGLDPGNVRVRNNTTRTSSRRDKATKSNVRCRKMHVSPPKIRSVKEGFAMGGTTRYEIRKGFEVLEISLAVVTCFHCSRIFLEVNLTTRISAYGGSSAVN
jgi:hypothetical protein